MVLRDLIRRHIDSKATLVPLELSEFFVACLYCGREIGPIRLLRDREFCSDGHRVLYRDRLVKGLDRLEEHPPEPSLMAGFAVDWPLQSGPQETLEYTSQFLHSTRPVFTTIPLPVSIAPGCAESAVGEMPPRPGALPAPPPGSLLEAAAVPVARAGLPFLRLPEHLPFCEPFHAFAGSSDRVPPHAGCLTLAPVPVERIVRPVADATACIAGPQLRLPEHLVLGESFQPVAGSSDRVPAHAGRLTLAPEPVERMVRPIADASACLAGPQLRLPECLSFAEPAPAVAGGLHFVPRPADGMPLPPAPVERMVQPVADATACAAKPGLSLPPLPLVPAPHLVSSPLAPPSLSPASASAGLEAPDETPRFWASNAARLPVPSMPQAPATTEQHRGTGIAPASWMPVPAAEPVEQWVSTISTAETCFEPKSLVLPSMVALSPSEIGIRATGGWRPLPSPEPAEAKISASAARSVDAADRQPRPVALPANGILDSLPVLGRPMAGFAPVPPPVPVESIVMPVALPARLADGSALCMPGLSADGRAPEAGLAGPAPLSTEPLEMDGGYEPAAAGTLTSIYTATPASSLAIPATGLPEAELVPLEYFCARGLRPISCRLEWMSGGFAPALPRFGLRLAVERVDEVTTVEQPRKRSSIVELFKSGDGRHKSSLLIDAVKTLAASLVMGSMVWYGLATIRQARMYGHLASNDRAPSESAPRPSDVMDGGRAGQAVQHPGMMARIRHAIAERAASELSDGFHQGMADWGAAKGFADGWTRHPDGYVRPGALALFQPSIAYKDYRLEFFGQIEQKAIDWAVRAQDPKNYYGMKFAVIEPGLRPMIAIVHYPVVGGKRGRPTSIPLNVMVHNNTAYHIAVDVRGDHIVTSIEGQEVDTWIDDTLGKGGIGFFAEAGERSRLYWMKVTRNEDFLGRICAMLSSESSGSTRASLDLPSSSVPWPGAPDHTSEATISAGLVLFRRRMPRLHNRSPYRRFSWNS